MRQTSVLIMVFLLSACSINEEYVIQAKEYIRIIENFKEQHGGYPSSLSEAGLDDKEEGPLYYRKLSENHFIIWYPKQLGTSRVYSSQSKTWKTEG